MDGCYEITWLLCRSRLSCDIQVGDGYTWEGLDSMLAPTDSEFNDAGSQRRETGNMRPLPRVHKNHWRGGEGGSEVRSGRDGHPNTRDDNFRKGWRKGTR